MNSSVSLLITIWLTLYGCGAIAAGILDYDYNMAAEFLIPQNNARASVGLPPLQWDTNLVNYAQWWAGQRQYYGRCLMQHSGGPYGENIFWGGSGRNWRPSDAVDSWVSERQWYGYYSNSCLYNKCGHYTQIIWRNTRYVGCARVSCSDGDVFMTCNYYPPGNYDGQRPY